MGKEFADEVKSINDEDSTPLWVVPEAAAIATVVTKSLLHPIDTVKCRMQAQRYAGARQMAVHYRGQWSPGHLYAGLPLKLVLYVPYQSVYMYSYNRAHVAASAYSDSTSVCALSGAVAAEGAGAAIRVPMEAMKMWLQSATSLTSAAAVGAIWRAGLPTVARLVVPQTLVHDLPYSVVQWMVYEHVRPRAIAAADAFAASRGPDTSALHFWAVRGATMLAGGCSGFVASSLTIPLDVVKTRVVVATGRTGTVPSTRATAAAMWRDEGGRAFFRGGAWRVFWITANMSVYFPILEYLREVLAPGKPLPHRQ